MGVIKSQAIKGSIILYVGTIIGFITTILLYPKFLTVQEIGLIHFMMGTSVVFGTFGSFGFNSITSRFFPYFKTEDKRHHGFLTLLCGIGVFGYLISITVCFLIKDQLIESEADASFFSQYTIWFVPLIFSQLFFPMLDAYAKMLHNVVLGVFWKEFVQRAVLLMIVVFLGFQLISFDQFFVLFIASQLLPLLALIVQLFRTGNIHFSWPISIDPTIRKDFLGLMFMGLFVALGLDLFVRIDSFVITKEIGLKANGIYMTGATIGVLVALPARVLVKIAEAIVAESWKQKDLKNINHVYGKTCLNLSVVSILLFLGIVINAHHLFDPIFLGEDYREGYWVIIFISASRLVTSVLTFNSKIIESSPSYKVLTYIMLVAIVLAIVLNYIFIPIYGISGAALATLFVGILYHGSKTIFLYYKYGFQPFSIAYVKLLLLGSVTLLIGLYLPVLPHVLLDMFYRSVVVSIFYALIVYRANISEDISIFANSLLEKIKSKRL